MINFDLPRYTPIDIAAVLDPAHEWGVPVEQQSEFVHILPDLEEIIKNIQNPIQENPQSLTCETGSPVYSFENSGGGRLYEFKFQCSGYTLDTGVIQSLLANRAGLSSITYIRDFPSTIDPQQGFTITDSSIDQFTFFVDGTTPDGTTVTTSVTLTTTELLAIFDSSIISTDPNQQLSSPSAPTTESLPPSAVPQSTEQLPPQPQQPTQPLPDAAAACASNPVNLDPESVDQTDSFTCSYDSDGNLVITMGPYTKISNADRRKACETSTDPKACNSVLNFARKDGTTTTLKVITAADGTVQVLSDSLFFPQSFPLEELLKINGQVKAKSKLSLKQAIWNFYDKNTAESWVLMSFFFLFLPALYILDARAGNELQRQREEIEARRQAEKSKAKPKNEGYTITPAQRKIIEEVRDVKAKVNDLVDKFGTSQVETAEKLDQLKILSQETKKDIAGFFRIADEINQTIVTLLLEIRAMKKRDNIFIFNINDDNGKPSGKQGDVVDGEVFEEPFGYLGAPNDYQDDE